MDGADNKEREAGRSSAADKRKKRGWVAAGILLLVILLIVYVRLYFYYPADGAAKAALVSDEVKVSQTSYGWFFDGPSEDTAMIFYPGAGVEETAYAPLLHALAAEGMDICLVGAPMQLAFLNPHAVDRILNEIDHPVIYYGGHSLGGSIIAFCSDHSDGRLKGLIMLASYPAKALPAGLDELVIVGSEDGIIDRKRLDRSRVYVSGSYTEEVIEGGNHAQFGSYGKQHGDGTALISQDEQISRTIGIIREHCLQ